MKYRFAVSPPLLPPKGIVLLLVLIAGAGCQAPPPAVDHVILITVDTMRADHLSLYGYPRETAPFITSLAERSILFKNAVAACSHTAPAHASMFTSLYPLEHRLVSNGQPLREGPLTMAEFFRDQGYETAGFVSAHFLSTLQRGFQHFDVRTKDENREEWGVRFRPVTATLGRAREWWQAPERSGKTFVWIHLYDVHETFLDETPVDEAYVEEMRSQLGGEDFVRFLREEHGIEDRRQRVPHIDRYDAAMLTVDHELRRLYEDFGVNSKFERALWIITSDHGEGLGNHGLQAHDRYIYQEQLRVPLLFHFTDERYPARQVDDLVRHVDFLPTLTHLVDGDTPIGSPEKDYRFHVQGHSLLPLLEGREADLGMYGFAQRRPAYKNRAHSWEQGQVVALQSRDHKYILHTQGDDEFFDLRNDPFEEVNLADEDSREKERMKDIILRMMADAMKNRGDAEDLPIDPKYVEELRALGYL